MLTQVSSNNREWFNFDRFEIENIPDNVLRVHSLKLRKNCIKTLILPLLINLPLHTGFKFSAANDNLSCEKMLFELFNEYHKRSYTKEEIMDIINGKRVKKR